MNIPSLSLLIVAMTALSVSWCRGQQNGSDARLEIARIGRALAAKHSSSGRDGSGVPGTDSRRLPLPGPNPPPGGTNGGFSPPSPQDFGTNLCLYLSRPVLTNGSLESALTISNTDTGLPYEIITSPLVSTPLSHWISAGVWPGGPGNTTPIPVALGTNAEYYFDARLGSIAPTNVQISNLEAFPGSNSATIIWMTQIPSDSTVFYGMTTSYGASTNQSSASTNHSMTISGLSTNTVYHYYVTSASGTNSASSADNEFTTLGGPSSSNSIYFVSTSTTVSMQVSLNASATTTWVWADGATTSTPNHTFGIAGTYTNCLTVSPASALTGFGAACQTSPNTSLSNVWGLTNYANLENLYFYLTGLSQLSLAGCSNLVYLALVGTMPSSTVENQWFIDLSADEPAMPPGSNTFCGDLLHYFYFPNIPGTNSTSASACSNLKSIGWTLAGY